MKFYKTMDDKFKDFLIEFVRWIKLKTRIHISDNTLLSYKVREIWWANVGMNIGSEQNGKDKKFQRPVLVFRKFGHQLFWAIPLTSNNKKHIYRLKIDYKSYFRNMASELIEENKKGFVVLNQLKAMSSKRLMRKIGVVPEDQFKFIKKKIKKML